MSTGQIHDLGYKRYVGDRRAMGTRWKVIMRHQLASTWKSWWRYKIWLIAGLIATSVAAGFLYFASGKLVKMFSGMGGHDVRLADGILPLSMTWYCPIGFLVSLTIGASLVAGDVQSGAFTFYFARSLRPRDYVIGKLAGLAILLSLIMLVGPLILAGLRLGLSDTTDELIAQLPTLSKALVVGVLGTLVYTAVPFGFSALIGNRGYAIALWAVYYMLIGPMAAAIAFRTTPAVAAIDLASALKQLAFNLFDVHLNMRDVAMMPTSAALISIFAHVALAVGLVFWRVQRAQQSGVGGAS